MHVALPGAEAVAPLSPTQSGMLFDLLTSPRDGMYVEQGLCTLTGPLDLDRFRAAWQVVVDRHPILRASFFWKGLSQPLQVIRDAVKVPLQLEEDGRTNIEEIAARHRRELQDLATPPLMRLHLTLTDSQTARCLWSVHHLIHDAWSLELLLLDFSTAYAGGTLAGRAPSFLESVTQMSSEHQEKAMAFWRDTLRGALLPTPALGEDLDRKDRATEHSSHSPARNLDFFLPDDEAEILAHVLAAHELTLNTLVLGAWAAVLAAWNRSDHVAFGTVLNGRSQSAQLEVVGPCITALPFGVRLNPQQPLLDLLRQLQMQQMSMMEFDTSTVAQIRQWLGADASRSLFSSLIVFQNALMPVEGRKIGSLHISGLTTAGFPSHPLMLRVTPGDRPRFELVYENTIFPEIEAGHGQTSLLQRLAELLRAFAADVGQTVDQWMEPLPRRPQAEPTPAARPRFGKLQSVKPKVFASGIQERALESGGTRVEVYEAQSSQELLPWLAANAERMTEHLKRSGAVLLRGFRPMEASGVEAALHAIAGESLEYRERSSPRTQVEGHIYTSTEHPPDQTIFFHNENSYAHLWPRKIAFYCKQPALTGGATPLADVRRVLARIPAEIRTRFERDGVRYLRNFDPYLGMSWQSAFQTADREEVEAACLRGGYLAEWRDGDRLRTWRTVPAIVRHPETDEALWFNHAAFFHLSTLEPTLQDTLRRTREEADLPNQTYFGDGSSISFEVASALRDAYTDAELSFPWQANDLLLLDNMLIAHGRQSFTGPRRILVGMAEPMGHTRPGDTR